MRHWWFAGALLLSALTGCEQPRPGFLTRLQQDCQSGDRDACGLLAGPAMAPGPQSQTQQVARPRTPVERDVDAIMQGMDRSRAASQNAIIPDEGG